MSWGFPYTQNPISDNEPASAPRWWTRFLSPCNDMLARLGDTGYLAASYTNGWGDYNAAVYQPGSYRLLNDEVWLDGLIAGGAIGAIFTLPAGYRPAKAQIFEVIANGTTVTQPGAARITVAASGGVSLAFYMYGGNNAYVSLSGIHFVQGG